MGSMRKPSFPFLTLFIVHQKLVFLSAAAQCQSRGDKKKRKRKTITRAVCPSFRCVNREGLRQYFSWDRISPRLNKLNKYCFDTSVNGVILWGRLLGALLSYALLSKKLVPMKEIFLF